jgi:tetratricopeptide (TPR) repeat protein
MLHVATPLVAAALCILPVTWRNWMVSGELVLVTSGGGEVFYMGQGPQARPFYNPPDFVVAAPGEEHEDFRREARLRTGREMSRAEASSYWFREGVRAILNDPLRSLKLTLLKGAVLLNDYDVPDSQSYAATRHFVVVLKILPSYGWVSGLGILGGVLCLRRREGILLLGMILAFVVSILLTYNFGRMRLGMMPLWLLLAAHAIVWIVRSIRLRGVAARRAMAGIIAALLITASSFYPLLAADFELSDRKNIAQLAIRGGQFRVAEEQLLVVLEKLKSIPVEESASQQYLVQIATIHQMLAEVYCRTGRYDAAVEQLERARRLPLREDAREHMLLVDVSLLRRVLDEASASNKHPAVSGELAVALEELRQLRPQRVEYWAMSLIYRTESSEIDKLDAGLEQTGAGLEDPTAQSQAWYWLGKAIVADEHGDKAAATEAAETVRRLWPDNPFEAELQRLIE